MINHISYSAKLRMISTVCIVLALVLGAVLFVSVKSSEKQEADDAEKLSEIDKQYHDMERTEALFSDETDADTQNTALPTTDYYEKLKSHKQVNVLFLGDSVASGAGVSADVDNWVNMIVSNFENSYGSDVKGGNYARPNTDTFYGYYIMNSYSRNLIYDLLVICYGAKDDPKTFEFYYDGLLHSIKKQNPKCEIICIIEADSTGYNDNSETIKKLCGHYGGICIDMVEYFKDNSLSYNNTMSDGMIPNIRGCRAYYDAVKAVVDKNYENERKVPEITEPYLDTSERFDNFIYVKIPNMTKISEGVYEYKTNAKIASLIYYQSYFGSGVRVYVNGKKVLSFENKFDTNITRQIRSTIISNNLSGKVKIRIETDGNDNVSNILGLALCGMDE